MKRIIKTLVLLLLCAMFTEAKAADVAQIGNTKYETFADALKEANKSSAAVTIKLLADCTSESLASIKKDVTIEGDNHTLTCSMSIMVDNKLTLKNVKLVLSGSSAGNNIVYVSIDDEGSLHVSNSTIDGSNSNSVYIVQNCGLCEFDGCELKACTSLPVSEFVYNLTGGSIRLSNSHIVSLSEAISAEEDADIQITNNNYIYTDANKTIPYFGKYSEMPKEIWVAPLGERVAWDGETFYPSLSRAIYAVKNGTIYVLCDNDEDELVDFYDGCAVTIEGCGHTISTPGRYTINGGNVTFKNLTFESTPADDGFLRVFNGTVNIHNCTIDVTYSHSPAIIVSSNETQKGHLFIYSGNFIGSSYIDQPGLYVQNDAECKLYGGTFSGKGGGVVNQNGGAGLLLGKDNLYYVTTSADGNHMLYNRGDFSANAITETVTVMEQNLSEDNKILQVYKGTSTPETSYYSFEWGAILEEYPNAIAVVSSDVEAVQEFARNSNNVLVEHAATDIYPVKTYTCAKFVLTDRDAEAKSIDFYTPVDFIALSGSYTRKIYENSNSMCVPFEVSVNDFSSPEDVDFLSFAYFEPIKNTDGAYVYFNNHDAVEAGVPCFVYAAKDVTLNKTFNETPICATPVNSSCLKGTFVKTTQYQGDEDNYGINSEGTKLASFAESPLGAFRSLLNLHNDLSAMIKNGTLKAKPNEIIIGIADDDATIINNVRTEENAAQNGIYTIEGQKINSVTKRGLYIINGKKVLK